MSLQQQLYDQIRKKVAPGRKFLLLKTAMPWNWVREVTYANPIEHQLVGTMPAPVGEKDGPSYVSSGCDIYDAYKTTLNSVKLDRTPEYERQLDQLDESIASAQADQMAAYTRFQAAWEDSNETDSDMEEWKENTGWDVQLSIHRHELDSLRKRWHDVIASHDADHEDAMAAIGEKRGFVKMLKSGGVHKVPNYLVATDGIRWRDSVADGRGNRVTIHLDSSNSSSNNSSSSSSNKRRKKGLPKKGSAVPAVPVEEGSEKMEFGSNAKFFSVYDIDSPSQGSSLSSLASSLTGAFTSPFASKASEWLSSTAHSLYTDYLDVESEKSTTIDVSFEAVTLVNVKPDPAWYHPTYLRKVGQLGNWLDGRTTKEIFGKNGFHSIVTGFVAAYRPSFSISTSSKMRKKMDGVLSKGSQFSLGPISFDGSKQDFTTSTSGDKLTIESKSDYAQIIGVCVESPYT